MEKLAASKAPFQSMPFAPVRCLFLFQKASKKDAKQIRGSRFFLVLLPGFTCAYITQYLAVRREQTELDKAIEALLFSSIIYLATLPCFNYVLPVSWALASDAQYHVHIDYKYFIVLFCLSVALGIAYAANINRDWGLSLLRKIRVTERTSRSALWHDVFQDTSGWVQVSMKDGKKALGWARYYSDDVDDRSLFLESASWIDDDGKEQQIDGPGLFLTKDSEIESVMFLASRSKDTEAS